MAKKGGTLKTKILSDCNPDVAFWVCNGAVIRNIYELANNVESMTDEAFAFHVNDEKNDFMNWVKDILGDKDLAKKLAKIRDKNKYLDAVKRRIKQLESS
jgi:hypothetical protein